MHFFVATALCLSLVQQSTARIPQSLRQLGRRNADPQSQGGLAGWLGQMLGRPLERRQATCYEDEYYEFVNNSTFGETFCQAYMKYPNTTTVVDFTPGITRSSIVTTFIYTDSELVRTTPVITTTTTIAPVLPQRREAQAPEAHLIKEAFALFNRQTNLSVIAPNPNVMSAAFSSACACQTYSGALVTSTYTNEPTVATTIEGFVRSTTTVFTTRTAGTLTSTVTVTASTHVSSAPSSGTTLATGTAIPSTSTISSSSASAPTGVPFTCPQDNNTVVSQMIGNERFDYLVLCNFDLPLDHTFYGALAYKTFSECAAACSKADAKFEQPLCQAAVYFSSPSITGYNCLLKSSAGTAVSAVGVDAAVLQRIAVGLNTSYPSGTSTEALPFASPSLSIAASDVSSQMASLMNASSTSMSMITPGPAFLAGGRQVAAVADFSVISTYESGGSTYSTGSYFSTSYTSNGSWYWSYYSTWSVAYASTKIVYAADAGSTQVAGSNVTTEYVQGGQNGGYVTVTNTSVTTYTYYTNNTAVGNSTDTIVYSTFAANSSFITASTTIFNYLFTYAAQLGSGGSGANGAEGAGASGPLSSNSVTIVTSSTLYSSASSGVVATPAPTISSTVIATTFTANGGFGSAGSGAIPVSSSSVASSYTSAVVSAASISSTVIVNTFGTGGALSTGGSGPLATGPPSLASSSTDTASFTSIPRIGFQSPSDTISSSVSITSYGTGGAFSTGGSGLIATGPPSPVSSSMGTASFTSNPRIGFQSPSDSISSSVSVTSFGTSGETSTAASGGLNQTSSSAPTLSSPPGYVATPSGSTSSSPSVPGSSGTLPSSLGTVSSSSSGTAPSLPPSSGSSDTSSSSPISIPSALRSGSASTSESSTTPIPLLPTESHPGYYPPTLTSSTSSTSSSSPVSSSTTSSYSASSGSPSSSATAPSSSGMAPSSSGTAPSSSAPSSAPAISTGASPSSSLPSGTATPSDTPGSFSDYTGSRTGIQFPSSTGSIPELPSSVPGYTPSTPSDTAGTFSINTGSRTGIQFPSSTGSIPELPSSAPGYTPPTPSDTAGTFSINTGSRTGIQFPSSTGTIPELPSSIPSYGSTMPSSTGPSSGLPSTPVNATTLPSMSMSTAPLPSSDTVPYNPNTGSRTGIQSPPGSTDSTDTPSSGVAPSSTPTSSGVPSSGIPSSGIPSSGIPSNGIPSTGVPPIITGPTGYPSSSLPILTPPASLATVTSGPPAFNTSCPTQGTTTIFSTVTLYGCYSQCLPNQGGYYPPPSQNAPKAFGSPP